MADITDFQGADIIDVRDVIERVEELRQEYDDLQSQLEGADESMTKSIDKDIQEWGEENAAELQSLESLLDDMCGYGGDHQWEGDWYPVTLIKESYFEEYMDDMLEDCGDIPKNIPPYLTITVDYDALKQDYSEVDFEGDTYYYR